MRNALLITLLSWMTLGIAATESPQAGRNTIGTLSMMQSCR